MNRVGEAMTGAEEPMVTASGLGALRDAANQARGNAWCPYSQFPVGASPVSYTHLTLPTSDLV